MSIKCTICSHPDVKAINSQLVAGESMRDLARRYGLNKSAILRHKQKHLPPFLVKAEEAREAARANDLFSEIEQLKEKARRIADVAEKRGDYRTALMGIRELTRIIELLAKLKGELQEPSVILVNNPQWISIRTTILETLKPFPDARIKLAEVLKNACQ